MIPVEKRGSSGINRSDVVRAFLFSGGVFLYLYTNLFSISHLPIFRCGDENFFWEYGSRDAIRASIP